MDDLNAINLARQEGKQEEKFQIARNMIRQELGLRLIEEITGLSQVEVEKIVRELCS